MLTAPQQGSFDLRPAGWPVVCVGVSLHAALLAGIAILLAQDAAVFGRPSLLVYLLLTTSWCVVEASSHEARPCCAKSRSVLVRRLPVAIGVALLASNVVSIADCASGFRLAWSNNIFTSMMGAVMMVIGIVMRCIAIRELGRFFLDELTLLDDHPRVTTGIYARMQHPSEIGTLLLATGTAILLGSPAGALVVLLVLLPLVLIRMRLENTLMSDRSHP